MPKNRSYPSKRSVPPTKKTKLPILLVISGAVILLIAGFFAFQKKPVPYTPATTGAPSLQVDKDNVDLGDMKLGSTAQVSFKITNVGDLPLRFTNAPFVEVKEGC